MQERVPRDDVYPWRVLVLCALLNRTGRRQVRPMFERFFATFQSPEALAAAGPSLEKLLSPLGLGARRASLLRRLSSDYASGVAPERCHGVGQYARDALAIFVRGDLSVRSADGFLGKYVTWRKRHGNNEE